MSLSIVCPTRHTGVVMYWEHSAFQLNKTFAILCATSCLDPTECHLTRLAVCHMLSCRDARGGLLFFFVNLGIGQFKQQTQVQVQNATQKEQPMTEGNIGGGVCGKLRTVD